jgi:hypothetical protein
MTTGRINQVTNVIKHRDKGIGYMKMFPNFDPYFTQSDKSLGVIKIIIDMFTLSQ